jgi:hypothetical protein
MLKFAGLAPKWSHGIRLGSDIIYRIGLPGSHQVVSAREIAGKAFSQKRTGGFMENNK